MRHFFVWAKWNFVTIVWQLSMGGKLKIDATFFFWFDTWCWFFWSDFILTPKHISELKIASQTLIEGFYFVLICATFTSLKERRVFFVLSFCRSINPWLNYIMSGAVLRPATPPPLTLKKKEQKARKLFFALFGENIF